MPPILLTVLGLLVFFLASGVWVGIALFAVGITGMQLYRSIPIEKLLAQMAWNTSTSPELVALPLFILMAEILFRTKLSESLFRGLAPWTAMLPGKLLHVNVLGCTLFAAVSGSSAATTATVGRMTLTELANRGYDRDLVMGSLAGAGTLGFLIPPSVIMIIYGVLAEESIIKLFIAGIIPGLLLAGSYMAYLGIVALVRPGVTPRAEHRFTWGERLRGLVSLGPVLLLMVMIVGSMYAGIASPTEAAAVGVLGALLIAAAQSSLTWPNLRDAFMAALRTSSMVGLIIMGAVFMSVTMGFLGVPHQIANAIAALNPGPFELILMLVLLYAVLGCILEGLSMIVMTLPITLPLVTQAGFDPIWFGVFLVLVVEMAQITPPVGFNLFVIQGMTGVSLGRIARAALPFFLIMAGFAVVLTLFPGIATYLPAHMTLRE